MNIKKELETKVGIASDIYLNDIDIDPLTIKAIMINEVVPSDPVQDFYGAPDTDYLNGRNSIFLCCLFRNHVKGFLCNITHKHNNLYIGE